MAINSRTIKLLITRDYFHHVGFFFNIALEFDLFFFHLINVKL